MLSFSMDKAHATALLGGTSTAAAEAIGITPQAYGQWPDRLPPRLSDRVVAALARKIFTHDVEAWLQGKCNPHQQPRA